VANRLQRSGKRRRKNSRSARALVKRGFPARRTRRRRFGRGGNGARRAPWANRDIGLAARDHNHAPLVQDAVPHGQRADDADPNLGRLAGEIAQRLSELRVQTEETVELLQSIEKCFRMSGPPLVGYGALRGWSPKHFRATLRVRTGAGYFNKPLSLSHSVNRSGQREAARALASCR
jgi:hypothetical protein